MKKFKLILGLLSLVSIFSCTKDDVEDTSQGDRIYGFKSPSSSYIYTSLDTDPVTNQIPVVLIGGADGTSASQETQLSYKLLPTSTATVGTHFTLGNSNIITIPAGRNFGMFPITIDPTKLPANTPLKIELELTSNQTESVIAANKKQMTITIAKCESDLEGTYSLKVKRLDTGVTYSFPNEVITEIALGEYVTSSTGPYGNGLLTSDGAERDGFIFKDVCQTISVEEQNLGNYYINMVNGVNEEENHVYLDPVTGNVSKIVMHYYIDGFSTGVAKRTFRAEYTKI